jgi:hypothetical protein
MLHTSLIDLAICSGTRSDTGRLAFLRLRTLKLAALVHTGKLGPQHVVHTPITKAPTRLGYLNDLVAELNRRLVRLGRMAVTVAGEPHKAACSTLGQVMLGNHLSNGLAFDLWG